MSAVRQNTGSGGATCSVPLCAAALRGAVRWCLRLHPRLSPRSHTQTSNSPLPPPPSTRPLPRPYPLPRYYGGSYDTFLKVRAEQRANQAAVAKDQEARSAHLKQFIQRFGHGNKKMARQAQSRMKMLKRMEGEAVEVDFDDPYLKLDFPSASALPPPCISVLDAAFGYDGQPLLYGAGRAEVTERALCASECAVIRCMPAML